MAGTGYVPTPDETRTAVTLYVQEVEQLANGNESPPFMFGGKMTDDLDMLVRELWESHPVTSVLVALSERGA